VRDRGGIWVRSPTKRLSRVCMVSNAL
jgi:hypothetical protein